MDFFFSWGYSHNRAIKKCYPHDGRADYQCYPHDGRADYQ